MHLLIFLLPFLLPPTTLSLPANPPLTGTEPLEENTAPLPAAYLSLASAQSALHAYAASTSAAYAATAIPPLPWSVQQSTGISLGRVNNSLPDPCGPPTQPTGAGANSSSTCHADVSGMVDVDAYKAACFNSSSSSPGTGTGTGTGMGTINMTTCAEAQSDICDQLTAATTVDQPLHDPPYDTWVWSRTSGGGCQMGFWLPDPAEGGAPVPSFERCVVGIYQVMMDACAGEAGVNLRVGNGTVDWGAGQRMGVMGEGYPSYVLLSGR